MHSRAGTKINSKRQMLFKVTGSCGESLSHPEVVKHIKDEVSG